jgi:hypothetical protein
MKLVILYRPNSEHARATEMFMHDFTARNASLNVEAINVDDRNGVALAGLYGIWRYPALLAVADDGVLLKYWEGDSLPLMDEVASYLYSGH